MFRDQEGGAAATNFRKNLYFITATTNSAIIFLISCVLAYCYMTGVPEQKILAAISMGAFFIQQPIISLLLLMALFNIRAILHHQ